MDFITEQSPSNVQRVPVQLQAVAKVSALDRRPVSKHFELVTSLSLILPRAVAEMSPTDC